MRSIFSSSMYVPRVFRCSHTSSCDHASSLFAPTVFLTSLLFFFACGTNSTSACVLLRLGFQPPGPDSLSSSCWQQATWPWALWPADGHFTRILLVTSQPSCLLLLVRVSSSFGEEGRREGRCGCSCLWEYKHSSLLICSFRANSPTAASPPCFLSLKSVRANLIHITFSWLLRVGFLGTFPCFFFRFLCHSYLP